MRDKVRDTLRAGRPAGRRRGFWIEIETVPDERAPRMRLGTRLTLIRRYLIHMKPYRSLELLRLGRIEFAGFLFCVMLSGALSLYGDAVRLSDVVVLLALALLSNQWSFAHNDWCDLEIDRNSSELVNRPLVRGTVSIAAVWTTIICCILANLAVAVIWLDGFWGLLVLLSSVILGLLYNKLSKVVPGTDILFAASTALLCFLGALLASGSQKAPGLTWNLVWVVVAIQFIDHVIFNAGATIKDVKNDSASSALTTAVFLGVKVGENDELLISERFRGAIILLRLLSLSALFTSPFWTGVPFTVPQAMLLAIVGSASLYLTISAMMISTFDRGLIGRRWMMQEATAKLMIPLLLAQTAGWGWCLFLIVVPFGWFLACNVVLYKKGARLRSEF